MTPGEVFRNLSNYSFDTLGKYPLTKEQAEAILPVLAEHGLKWKCPECGKINESARKFCWYCNSEKERGK